jgi:hypothetical protein
VLGVFGSPNKNEDLTPAIECFIDKLESNDERGGVVGGGRDKSSFFINGGGSLIRKA